jgi:hypothetical protein
MSARVGESLGDDSSAVGTLCGPMKNSFARLFERARQEVPLRPDMAPALLLSIVSALPKDPGTGRTIEPCLRVVLDGLRTDQPAPQGSPASPSLAPLRPGSSVSGGQADPGLTDL